MRDFLSFRNSFGKTVRVDVKDIAYFKADLKYIVMYYGDGKEGLLPLPTTIRELEKEFCPHLFLRVHRNALVATRVISNISPDLQKIGGAYTIMMSDHTHQQCYWTSLSKRNVSKIKQWLKKGKL